MVIRTGLKLVYIDSSPHAWNKYKDKYNTIPIHEIGFNLCLNNT